MPTAVQAPLDDTRPLAALLRDRLEDSPVPVLMTGDRTLPAASLWTSARAISEGLRRLGLAPGERIVIATSDDLVLASAVIGCMTGGFVAVPVAAGASAAGEEADRIDAVTRLSHARLVLRDPAAVRHAKDRAVDLAGVRPVDGAPLPTCSEDPQLQPPGTALLLAGSGVWTPWSQADLVAALIGHLGDLHARGGGGATGPYGLDGRLRGVMTSSLPWTEPMGFILDLLVALLTAHVVLRDAKALHPIDVRLIGLQHGHGCVVDHPAGPRTR